MAVDDLDRLGPQGRRRHDTGAIAGMDTSFFDVLHDGAHQRLACGVAHCIDIDLDGVFQELVHQNRPLSRQPAFPPERTRGRHFPHGSRDVLVRRRRSP